MRARRGRRGLLIDADPTADRIRLKLELDQARCDDCILPPDQLKESLTFALHRRLVGEFELIIDDPRTAIDDPRTK